MTMEKISSFGLRLQRLTLGLILLTPLAIIVILGMKGPLAFVTLPMGVEVNTTFLTFPRSMAIITVGLLTSAMYLFCFIFLYKLFGLYAKGIVFSEQSVMAIRRSGYSLMAVDVVHIIQSALTGPVLTAMGAVKGYLTVEIGFSMLFVGLSVVLVSRVMEMGLEIYERDQLTI